VKWLIGAAFAVIAIPAAIVLLVVSPPLDALRANSASLCEAMLGPAPQPRSTLADLAGPETVSLAGPAGRPALTGDDAYRFVTTVNRIVNWRDLDPAAMAVWAANPDSAPPPAGAITQPPWPAPPLPEDSAETLAAAGDIGPYGRACATVLARVDASPKPASNQPPPAEPRTPLAETVNARIGTPSSAGELWQAVNPQPGSDARTMLLDTLVKNPASRVYAPGPGDFVCYDFTVDGPTHCALVLPDSTMATAAAGTVTTAPIARVATFVRPIATASVAP
jgi:hypothetical protein